MDHQIWDAAVTANMFNTPNHNGPFPTNVQSYFRRPSKVVKPSSRNSSPRNTGRRRMTTTGHFPARTRSVISYERASMPQLSQYSQPISNRPISWHPNTIQDMTHLQVPHHYSTDSVMASPYTTIEMNGLVTPMSFPMMDEPQIQELITPLEGLSANDAANAYNQSQDFSMEAWLNQQQQQQMKNLNGYHTSMYPDSRHGNFYGGNQYDDLITNMPTAPSSPDYLPMPNLGGSLSENIQRTETHEDELVGMGLYDSPAEVQSSSLLFGGGAGIVARKTLKLEDAFEPVPSSDDDDDEDDDDEDEDAPGEPDDDYVSPSINTNEAAGHSVVKDFDGSMVLPANNVVYSSQGMHDFAALQPWQMSSGGHGAWI